MNRTSKAPSVYAGHAAELMSMAVSMRAKAKTEVPPMIGMLIAGKHLLLMPAQEILADRSDYKLDVVRRTVEKMPEIEAVLLVHEVWMSKQMGTRPSQAPDRTEAIHVAIITPLGASAYFAPIDKDSGVSMPDMTKPLGDSAQGRLCDWFKPLAIAEVAEPWRSRLEQESESLMELLRDAFTKAIESLSGAPTSERRH